MDPPRRTRAVHPPTYRRRTSRSRPWCPTTTTSRVCRVVDDPVSSLPEVSLISYLSSHGKGDHVLQIVLEDRQMSTTGKGPSTTPGNNLKDFLNPTSHFFNPNRRNYYWFKRLDHGYSRVVYGVGKQGLRLS